MSQQAQVRGSIVVIGDEIIKGKVHDLNSHFLCQRLHALGLKITRIITVGDEVDEIAEVVREQARTSDVVFTTGGIGPTHDDVTYEAIAKAFQEPLVVHPTLDKLVRGFFKENFSSQHERLTRVPKTASFLDTRPLPMAVVRNVYILPGVPSFLQNAFLSIESRFRNPYYAYHSRELHVGGNADEVMIAEPLAKIATKYPAVTIGSYPFWQLPRNKEKGDQINSNNNNNKTLHDPYAYRVKLTFDSLNLVALEKVVQETEDMLSTLGASIVHPAHRLPSRSPFNPDLFLHGELARLEMLMCVHPACTSVTKFPSLLSSTVQIMREAMTKFPEDSSQVCVGFNGGKDCTVLLHLWAVLRHAMYKSKNVSPPKLLVLYIRGSRPFPEVEQFIAESTIRYNLEVIRLEGAIKEQLTELKQTHPSVKAVVMGTRRTDPHSSHLSAFSPTDPSWPSFVRVLPILDWGYSDVWMFLRSLNVPYCPLYDRGYTSLGCMTNTIPSDLLRYVDENGTVKYHPAYKLDVCTAERAGRNVSSSTTHSRKPSL